MSSAYVELWLVVILNVSFPSNNWNKDIQYDQ